MFLRDRVTLSTGEQRHWRCAGSRAAIVAAVSSAVILGLRNVLTRCVGIAAACAVVRPLYAAALARSCVRRFRSKHAPRGDLSAQKKIRDYPLSTVENFGEFSSIEHLGVRT
jgi:hypothetical protein